MSEIKLDYLEVNNTITNMKIRAQELILETEELVDSSKSDTMQKFIDTYAQLKDLIVVYKELLEFDLNRINTAADAICSLDETAAISVYSLGTYRDILNK